VAYNSRAQSRPDTSARALTTIPWRWIFSALLVPAAVGVLAYNVFGLQAPAPTTNTIRDISVRALPELPLPSIPEANSTPAAPLTSTIEFVVRRNDTMERIFRQLKLSVEDLAAIRDLPGIKKSLDFLKPGELITVVHADGLLQTLTRRISDTSTLSVERADEGFAAKVIETPLDVRVAQTHGRIESSLFNSGRAAGLSADLIMKLADNIFGWDIDFALDIQPGDEFTVVYEQKYRNGEFVSNGNILAAEFINDGHVYRAVRYESPDGQVANYYTPEGRSMHKQFLRAPVDFTYISSNFSLRRYHPILNIIRAHKGVDYAAPTGTPIRAAGDGKVDFAGVKGGYGNVITIEHGAGISTVYGHMSRFAKGIHNGSRVSQGETIGYVGMTGAATGPHLHYEYRVNGEHKDPRTVSLPNAMPIPAEYLANFQARAGQLMSRLDRAKDSEIIITARR
jgi:murein DD-endopeptidase MepM/ murein hydrolase activator NlpD